MIEFLMAAPASGSGKTALTCAMLEALRRRGLNPCAFKCGPDYIDPMFHRSVLEVDSHNLDLFLAEPEQVKKLYARYAQGLRFNGLSYVIEEEMKEYVKSPVDAEHCAQVRVDADIA